MAQGYYSLIQYCPDFSRAETANVGLLLFQVEPPTTAVRVVDDVRPAMRRLGRTGAGTAATILEVVQSMRSRIELERFQSVESLDHFKRTRGNQIQMTAPRSMRIESIERDLDAMFEELVASPERPHRGRERRQTLLARAFEALSRRSPGQVMVRPELRVRGRELAIHPDYAYRNGRLNVVQEVSVARQSDSLRTSAFALSREGELVRDLEEGEGRLVVVSRTDRAVEREQEFGAMLQELGFAEFVPYAEVERFARQVETELSDH
jgi:hypothetical protein